MRKPDTSWFFTEEQKLEILNRLIEGRRNGEFADVFDAIWWKAGQRFPQIRKGIYGNSASCAWWRCAAWAGVSPTFTVFLGKTLRGAATELRAFGAINESARWTSALSEPSRRRLDALRREWAGVVSVELGRRAVAIVAEREEIEARRKPPTVEENAYRQGLHVIFGSKAV